MYSVIIQEKWHWEGLFCGMNGEDNSGHSVRMCAARECLQWSPLKKVPVGQKGAAMWEYLPSPCVVPEVGSLCRSSMSPCLRNACL